MTLTPQEESFCAAYAEGASGAEAARLANYSIANARNQASRMLTRPEVADRVAELTVEFVQRRARRQEELAARLDRIYDKALAADDDDGVLQVIELQSRILGFVKGGAQVRGSFQRRDMERRTFRRVEDERRQAQEAWDAMEEEERLHALDEEAEATEAATDETACEPPPPEPEPLPVVQVADQGLAPVSQPEPEPAPDPEPDPAPDPEPAKASISQQSSPALSLDELLRGTAKAKRRYREQQRNLNNRP